MNRRFSFTLIEILVALTIASLVASAIGVQTVRFLARYFFEQEVEGFTTALKEAQWLTTTYQTDIRVHFKKENAVFYYCLETDEPFIKIPLDRERKKLKHVKKLIYNQKSTEQLTLTLYSGSLEPRGTLAFVSADKAERWLDFQGAFALTLSSKKPSTLTDGLLVFPEKIANDKDTRVL